MKKNKIIKISLTAQLMLLTIIASFLLSCNRNKEVMKDSNLGIAKLLQTKLDSIANDKIIPGVSLSVRFKDQTNISLDSGWDYADSHYLILGLIIEKVKGKSYYEVLNGLIIEPYNQSYTKPSEKIIIPGL